jgi:protein-L-isoaspartate(D-aspartate) O-methyltransferase
MGRSESALGANPPPRPGTAMVRDQIAARDVKDERVLAAMSELDRRLFVPNRQKKKAFTDYPLPIGRGQTISQPYIVAKMTELLEVEPGQRVLEIGTGSGYQAAVLSRLGVDLVTVERHRPLMEQARENLKAAGCENVECVLGDGSRGWPDGAPYDRIIVTAAAEKISPELLEQLKDGGLLVAPEVARASGSKRSPGQVMRRWRRNGSEFFRQDLFNVRFVPLVGEPAED